MYLSIRVRKCPGDDAGVDSDGYGVYVAVQTGTGAVLDHALHLQCQVCVVLYQDRLRGCLLGRYCQL